MKGIYKYTDLKTSDVVYIGKDSCIDKNIRYNQHLQPSKYDEQQINRVLQNNPNRYEYDVICAFNGLSDDELNYLEIKEIMKHKLLHDEKPKFNFTIGGDGCHGYKHTEESIQKMKKPKQNTDNYHKPKTDEHKINLSKSLNTTGYYRVTKNYDKTRKNGFRYRYQYYDEDGKRKTIWRTTIEDLEKAVKDKGLEWRKLNDQ